MGLNVYSRYAYDDVAFIASTDADANAWRLEVGEGAEEREWVPVDAVLMDSHLNWSTRDLSLWELLRLGEPAAIAQVFPDASGVVPAGTPFAVMWNVSRWYKWNNPKTGEAYQFRYSDPSGGHHEFLYREVLWLKEQHSFE